MMPLRAAVTAVPVSVGFAIPQALYAQSYPARTVTLIVPSAAGGGTDTIARLIGDQLSKQLGQAFTVENRTGGGMKSRPGQIDYASAGNGTGQHLAPELFKMMPGTEMGHVPYRGAQPAYQDVISGRMPVFFDNMSTAMSLVKGGKVRALAVTSKQRSALMPELPTVDEAGVPGYEYYTWFGLWAPKGTPQPIVQKLDAQVRNALADPTVQQRLADTAGEPSRMASQDIEPFVKAEIAKWAEVVKRAGIKVE